MKTKIKTIRTYTGILVIACVLATGGLLSCSKGSPRVVPADIIDTGNTDPSPGYFQPEISEIEPANGATGVYTNTMIVIRFNIPIDPVTLIPANITLASSSLGTLTSGTEFSTTMNDASNPTLLTISFTNSGLFSGGTVKAPLPAGDTITITLSSNIKSSKTDTDIESYPLLNAGSFHFSTGSIPDETAPVLNTSSLVPANGASSIALNLSAITVSFTEAGEIDATSINTKTFYLEQAGTRIPCTRTYSAATNTATLIPSEILSPGLPYTVIITTGIRDLSGNTISSVFNWTFTTTSTNYDPVGTAPSFDYGPNVDGVDAGTLSSQLSWTSNKPVNYTISYGRNTTASDNTVSDPNSTKYYADEYTTISGLTQGRKYWYKITLTDKNLNTASSPVGSFNLPTTDMSIEDVSIANENQTTAGYVPSWWPGISSNYKGAILYWTDDSVGNNSIYAQKYDSTFTKTWLANGTPVFNESSHDYQIQNVAEDFSGGAIFTVTRDGAVGFYAKRMDSTGAVYNWGTSSDQSTDTGVQISSTGDSPVAAVVYNGYASTIVAAGTTEMNYNATSTLRFFDRDVDFTAATAVANNDVVVVPTTRAGSAVTTTNYRHMLNLSSAAVVSGNVYYIGDGIINFGTYTAEDHAIHAGSTYTNSTTKIYSDHMLPASVPSWLGTNDLVLDNTTSKYVRVTAARVDHSFTALTTNTAFSTQAYHMYSSGTSWSSTVAAGDIVANITDGTFAAVTSVVSNTELVLDTDIFSNSADSYAIFRADIAHQVDTGSPNTPYGKLFDYTKSWTSTVNTTDLVYYFVSTLISYSGNISSVVSNNELTLSSNVCTETDQTYNIYDTVTSGTCDTPISLSHRDGSYLYDASVTWTLGVNYSIGDTVTNTDDTNNGVITGYDSFYNELILDWQVFNGGSGEGYIVIHGLKDSGNPDLRNYHLTCNGKLWTSNVSNNYLVVNTTTSGKALVTNVTNTDLTLNADIFEDSTNTFKVYMPLNTSTACGPFTNSMYDGSANFSSILANDLVYNTTDNSFSTVNSVILPTVLNLDYNIFSATSEGYKLYHNYCTTHLPTLGLTGQSSNFLNPFFELTVTALTARIANGTTFTAYNYIGKTGTADAEPSNPLYDTNGTFTTYPVIASDFALNFSLPYAPTDPAVSRVIGTVYAQDLSLNTSDPVFTDADDYSIIRGLDTATSTIITIGAASSVSSTHLVSSANHFTTYPVVVGDLIYNITDSRHAVVTSVNSATDLTLSNDIFDTIGDRYAVIRQKGILFVWHNGSNIYGCVVSANSPSTVLKATATLVTNAQNPKLIPDMYGNAILVYENTFSNRIQYRLLNSAMTIIDSGTVDTTNPTQTILSVIPDDEHGAMVLYKSAGTSIRGQWLRQLTAGTITPWPGVSGFGVISATTSDEDFGYSYNSGTPYIIAVYTKGDGNIYAKRAYNGAVGETTICSESSNQSNPHIFLNKSDPTRTIITWDDDRYWTSVGYAIFGMEIDATTMSKTWIANAIGGTDDTNGIALIFNKYNDNIVNNLIVPYVDGGSTKAHLIWQDYRNYTTGSRRTDLQSYPVLNFEAELTP